MKPETELKMDAMGAAGSPLAAMSRGVAGRAKALQQLAQALHLSALSLSLGNWPRSGVWASV